MKQLTFLFACALFLAGGCTDPEPVAPSDDESRVGVDFCLRTVETAASLEPMTRATAYKNWIRNSCRVLILKKEDTRWIVDGTQTVKLDPSKGSYSELQLTSELPPSPFRFELRPGHYRAVAVINYGSANWNKELVPGTVVADEAVDTLRTPPLLTYWMMNENWQMNKGYRMLNREVFVAVAEFTVPKSEELHASGMPPVALQAERRVGKIRFLLKDKRSPVKHYTFKTTDHRLTMILTSSKPFPEGVDALGETYYGDPALYELPWCMSTVSHFHTSGGERYQICQTNSTVFSPFLFADPDAGEQPYEVTQLRISGASGFDGFSYTTDEVFPLTLAPSRIGGLVFQTTDHSVDGETQPIVDIIEATDAEGRKEDAVALFDSFYEWNAVSD